MHANPLPLNNVFPECSVHSQLCLSTVYLELYILSIDQAPGIQVFLLQEIQSCSSG